MKNTRLKPKWNAVQIPGTRLTDKQVIAMLDRQFYNPKNGRLWLSAFPEAFTIMFCAPPIK